MLRIVIIVVLVLIAAAIHYLPWWAIAGGLVVLIVVARLLGGKLLETLLSIPFRLKGSVLRHATAEIHSIKPVPKPVNPLSTESDDSPPRNYYEVEATITPRPSRGPFHLWEYSELVCVKSEAKWDDDSDACETISVELAASPRRPIERTTSDDEEDDCSKVPGSQRLRVVIGVIPGTNELSFRYYLEKIGRFCLPPAQSQSA